MTLGPNLKFKPATHPHARERLKPARNCRPLPHYFLRQGSPGDIAISHHKATGNRGFAVSNDGVRIGAREEVRYVECSRGSRNLRGPGRSVAIPWQHIKPRLTAAEGEDARRHPAPAERQPNPARRPHDAARQRWAQSRGRTRRPAVRPRRKKGMPGCVVGE